MTKPVPRIRKQKARRRAQEEEVAQPTAPASDPNEVEILPATAAERQERKDQLRDEVLAQRAAASKMNGKKRKRLDKYIDTKLKKEENLELIKKLAVQKVDTSLFKSSKKLGRGDESKRERLGRILREKRAGIGAAEEQDELWEKSRVEEEEESSLSEDDTQTMSVPAGKHKAGVLHNDENVKPNVFGSGLKRPLHLDASGNSVIQQRKRVKVRPRASRVQTLPIENGEETDSEWEGLDANSEDSGVVLDGVSNDDTHIRQAEEEEEEEEEEDSGGSEEYDEDDETSGNSMDESEEMSDDDDVDDEQNTRESRKERSSAFKAWASEQRNEAVGFTPSTNIDVSNPSKPVLAVGSELKRMEGLQLQAGADSRPADHERDHSDKGLAANTSQHMSLPRKIFIVDVQRTAEIDEVRLQLPVVAEEQKIMEAIHNNDTVILWGATGSGKTTQVPQFLFEAGYGSPKSLTPGIIGITQPRRVAAVSMAKRVAVEMGDHGDKVSYQIRFDSNVKSTTAIKFMTDGVLVREISHDFALSKYSAIVIDEAHERSVNTDILIGMLSRIVETRADLARKTKYTPLKLIIMSATLQTTDLTQNKNLFRKSIPPIIQAEGRQYPVAIHFAKRTQRDYLEETFRKVSKGHKKLPQGAILVFLTGQSEISNLSTRLKQAFAATESSSYNHGEVRTSATEASIENEDVDLARVNHDREDDASDSDAEITGLDNDEENEFNVGDETEELLKVHVLPLYSQLPTDQQMRVFEAPPEGSRMIVLATNVAETSLTIANVRYVFDCGRAKQKYYDKESGVQSFDVGWISKASASQRSGRAGRTGPGHCYRLYSSAVYERDFAEFTEPEISRTPMEGVVLQLKSMGIPNVANFPFPTSPERSSLVNAEHLLEYLGAINGGKVTELGKGLAIYPLSPRLSRMLYMAQSHPNVNHAITLVAALAVSDFYIPESQFIVPPIDIRADSSDWTDTDRAKMDESHKLRMRHREYNKFLGHLSRIDRNSDALKLFTTLDDFVRSFKPSSSVETSSSVGTSQDLFRSFARMKALQEAVNLQHQLTNIILSHKPGSVPSDEKSTLHLMPKQIKLLNQLVAAGFIDQIAIRASLSPTPPASSRQPNSATDVPYFTLFPSWTASDRRIIDAALEGRDDNPKTRERAERMLKSVYIHPSSVLAHKSIRHLPQYIIYSHLSRAAPSTAASTALPRTRIHPLTTITAPQIVALASGTPLLDDSKPIGKIEMLERDEAGRERRRVTCVPFLRAGREAGANEWPLPPSRTVVQRREAGAGWVVEKIEK